MASTIQKLQPIGHGGLITALADAIAERVLRGEFGEGDQIRQEQIAKDYDVSRTPVREALRQVEAWGLIEHRPNRGAVVKSMPTERIAELYDLRAVLEADLLARAIPRMRDEDIDVARAVLPLLENAYEERDIARWGDLNWRFHEALYAPSLRIQTIAIVVAINLQTERYVRLHLMLTHAFEAARDDHRELVLLCAARDTERAVPFLRKHIMDAGRGLLRAIEENRHKHHC